MLKFLLILFLSKMQQSEEKTLRIKRPSDIPVLLYTVLTVPKNKNKRLNAKFKHINIICLYVQKGLKSSIQHFKN